MCFFETCYHETGSLGILGALTDTVVAVHTLEDFVTAGFLWRVKYFLLIAAASNVSRFPILQNMIWRDHLFNYGLIIRDGGDMILKKKITGEARQIKTLGI